MLRVKAVKELPVLVDVDALGVGAGAGGVSRDVIGEPIDLTVPENTWAAAQSLEVAARERRLRPQADCDTQCGQFTTATRLPKSLLRPATIVLTARAAAYEQTKKDMSPDDAKRLESSGGDVGPPGSESSADHQRRAEDEDLRDSLAGLSRLASSRLSLEDLLTRVARYAVQAIPGADGAGLTLLEQNRAETIVATAPFVSEVDEIQYGMRQGPCISAAHEGRTVISGSLGGDPRWPRFGGQVARRGVHSVVSLPLLTPDGVVGAMNVYAHAKEAFDDRAAELGEIFAAPAAIAVQNAQVLAHTRRLANQLQSALETRGVIDRAVGILMSRTGSTEQEALDRLRSLSQQEHHRLAVVAGRIIDEAVRRARARHRAD
jgi:GAF domain-containing protein